MIWLLFLSLIALAIAFALWPNRKVKLLENVYGYPTLPFIGNMHQMGTNSLEIFKTMCKMWADSGYTTFKMFIGNEIAVFVTEPHTAEVILSNNEELDKSGDYSFFHYWLGEGLIFSNGERWRRNRKLLTPSFHFKIMEKFIEVFNRNSDVLVEIFNKEVDKAIDIYQPFSRFALDIIVDSVMGVQLNAITGGNAKYVDAIYRVCEILHLRSFTPYYKFNILYKLTKAYQEEKKYVEIMHKVSKEVIKTRKATLQKEIETSNILDDSDAFGAKKKVSFLDLLLITKNEDGTPLSDEMIQNEVDTFMFAGHDTTSSVLSFAAYLLSKNPKVQQKAFEEQISIFGNDKTQAVTLENISQMKYLDMFVKETLRIYPSAPMVARLLKDDLRLKDGVVIPAGTTLWIFIYAVGRNPRYVENPEVCDPERFSPENTKGKNPFSHIPFSAGPRNCIGQKFAMTEVKAVLSKLIRNFEFHNEGIENHELKVVFEVTLKSKSGIMVKMRKRQ